MGVDVAIILPTPMMLMGMHPQIEFEAQIAAAYNRWLVEKVLSESDRTQIVCNYLFRSSQRLTVLFKILKTHPGSSAS